MQAKKNFWYVILHSYLICAMVCVSFSSKSTATNVFFKTFWNQKYVINQFKQERIVLSRDAYCAWGSQSPTLNPLPPTFLPSLPLNQLTIPAPFLRESLPSALFFRDPLLKSWIFQWTTIILNTRAHQELFWAYHFLEVRDWIA